MNFAAVIAILAGLFFATRGNDDTAPALPAGPDGFEGVRLTATQVGTDAGLTGSDLTWWVNMAQVQAYSESRGNRLASNKTDSEANASRSLLLREFPNGKTNLQMLRESLGELDSLKGDAVPWWRPGSGGWFGLFPVNIRDIVYPGGVAGFSASLIARLNHTWIFDARISTVAYMRYVWALTRRQSFAESSQDAYAIKAGGASPSLMNDPTSSRYQKAAENLQSAMQALGINSGWAMQPVPQSIRNAKAWGSLFQGN